MASRSPLEAQAQATIVELAQLRRWRVYHTRDSRGSQGGYPDLTLVRDRLIFAELKRVGEKPRADQVGWLNEIALAGGEVYLWTIDDLGDVGRILERRWSFVPAGESGRISDGTPFLDGPRLIDRDGRVSMAPRSAWIPGVGRRDAA